MSPALIFDCDGVLADTERDGHLKAFNLTFQQLGVPLHWSDEDYEALLTIGGGKERMRSALTPALINDLGLEDEEDREAAIAGWHTRKTRIFTELVESGRIVPRPGVARLIGEALGEGWNVAVASTSVEESVRAVLEGAVGVEVAATIPVFAGDIVGSKKPAPDVYLAAIRGLDVRAAEGLAIEDSRNGLLAATTAGLSCLVARSSFTVAEDMSEAIAVVSSLGDPGGPQPLVERNDTGVPIDGPVTIPVLRACVDRAVAASGRSG